MRRRVLSWLIVLAVLAGLLVAADRAAVYVAEQQIANRIAASPRLAGADKPAVTLTGFPFLTQVFGGDYQHAHVVTHNLTVDGLRLATLTADLRGIHVPFSKLTSGSVGQAPVDRVGGSVLVAYTDLNKLADMQGASLSFRGQDGSLIVTGSLTGYGESVQVFAKADVAVLPSGAIKVTAHDVQALGGVVQLPPGVSDRMSGDLTRTVTIPTLPFGLKLVSIKATAKGLVGVVSGHDILLSQ